MTSATSSNATAHKAAPQFGKFKLPRNIPTIPPELAARVPVKLAKRDERLPPLPVSPDAPHRDYAAPYFGLSKRAYEKLCTLPHCQGFTWIQVLRRIPWIVSFIREKQRDGKWKGEVVPPGTLDNWELYVELWFGLTIEQRQEMDPSAITEAVMWKADKFIRENNLPERVRSMFYTLGSPEHFRLERFAWSWV